jgi:hypothetical protein
MQNFKTRTYHQKVINNMSWKTLVCLQKEWKYDTTHFFKKCHNNLEYNVYQGTSSQECVLGKKNCHPKCLTMLLYQMWRLQKITKNN